jgi:serine/threonine-protein kinase
MTLGPGTRLGPYEIRAALGQGGMGQVYRAYDARLERTVAVKVLPGAVASDPALRVRLLREARIASQLNHPNICTVHDVGETDGRIYFAMEFVPGRSLETLVGEPGLAVDEALGIARQVADALAHAHGQGVVHRDLKAANVVVTSEGRAKILDFGLALRRESLADEATHSTRALADDSAMAGTLPYMSPEQLRGQPAGPRSDVWSFGILLHELLHGRRPFQGATGFELTSAILRDDPDAVSARVPPGIADVIRRCLAKDPAQRYAHATELKAALDAGVTGPTFPGAAAASAGSPGRSTRTRIALLAFVVATLVAVAAVGAWLTWHGRPRAQPNGPGGVIDSVAVLPLANLSGSADQDYFADGVTEAVINDLAQIRALRVISRQSVVQYKGTTKPLRQIARELGVRALVEGSVQRAGTRVRVNAELIDAQTETHLWARSYERDLQDVLALQSELAGAIADAVRVELTPREKARLTSAHRVSPEAYDYYLRGRVRARRENREDNDAAIALLEKAVAADPQFAAAHAELSRAYGTRLFYLVPGDKSLDERALAEVDKALAIDPDSAEAHLALGLLVWTPRKGFPHEQAIQEYRRAIALNPGLDEAHHQLGIVYMHIGLLDESFAEVEQALKLNPANTLALYRLGVVRLYQQRYQEAWDVFQQVPLDFNPSLVAYQSSWTLFQLGRVAEAEALATDYLRTRPNDPGGVVTAMQALFAAAAGRPAIAESRIVAALKLGRNFGHFHHTAYTVAEAYARMGRPSQAVRWLEQAATDGLPCYPLFDRDPNLDPIRREPAFVAFMERQKARWEGFRRGL